MRGLSVRAAATGTISFAPSSVAFSTHHSKRLNFTSEIRRLIRSAGSEAGTGSTKANSIPALTALGERHSLDLCQPDAPPIAELVKLPGFGAKNATQMVGDFPAQDRGGLRKVFHEKAGRMRRF